LRGEIYADYSTLFPNFVSSQNDVYPAAAAEIHGHLTGLKVRKASRVATTPREIESNLRYYVKLFLAIELRVNCIARTGLSLARSTGLLVTTCFGEFAVTDHNRLFDFVGNHLFHSIS
jgi:hypothetical protein